MNLSQGRDPEEKDAFLLSRKESDDENILPISCFASGAEVQPLNLVIVIVIEHLYSATQKFRGAPDPGL